MLKPRVRSRMLTVAGGMWLMARSSSADGIDECIDECAVECLDQGDDDEDAGTSGVGGSPGVVTLSTEAVPCWVDLAPSPTDGVTRNRLPIGYASARYRSGGSRVATADAFYDADTGDCGWGDNATNTGSPDAPDDDYQLELFLTGAWHIDHVTDDGGVTRVTLDVNRVSGCASCPGPFCILYESWSFQRWCSTGSIAVAWREGRQDELISGACDIPRIIDTTPSASPSITYYYYTILTEVCNLDGAGCTTGTDTGCMELDWQP